MNAFQESTHTGPDRYVNLSVNLAHEFFIKIHIPHNDIGNINVRWGKLGSLLFFTALKKQKYQAWSNER